MIEYQSRSQENFNKLKKAAKLISNQTGVDGPSRTHVHTQDQNSISKEKPGFNPKFKAKRDYGRIVRTSKIHNLPQEVVDELRIKRISPQSKGRSQSIAETQTEQPEQLAFQGAAAHG